MDGASRPNKLSTPVISLSDHRPLTTVLNADDDR